MGKREGSRGEGGYGAQIMKDMEGKGQLGMMYGYPMGPTAEYAYGPAQMPYVGGMNGWPAPYGMQGTGYGYGGNGIGGPTYPYGGLYGQGMVPMEGHWQGQQLGTDGEDTGRRWHADMGKQGNNGNGAEKGDEGPEGQAKAETTGEEERKRGGGAELTQTENRWGDWQDEEEEGDVATDERERRGNRWTTSNRTGKNGVEEAEGTAHGTYETPQDKGEEEAEEERAKEGRPREGEQAANVTPEPKGRRDAEGKGRETATRETNRWTDEEIRKVVEEMKKKDEGWVADHFKWLPRREQLDTLVTAATEKIIELTNTEVAAENIAEVLRRVSPKGIVGAIGNEKRMDVILEEAALVRERARPERLCPADCPRLYLQDIQRAIREKTVGERDAKRAIWKYTVRWYENPPDEDRLK